MQIQNYIFYFKSNFFFKKLISVQEPPANLNIYDINFKNAKLLEIINTIPKESLKTALSNYDNEELYNYVTDPLVVKKMMFFIFSKEEIVYNTPKKEGKEQLSLLLVKDYISEIICNKDFDDILDTIVNDRGLMLYIFSYLKKDPIITDGKAFFFFSATLFTTNK